MNIPIDWQTTIAMLVAGSGALAWVVRTIKTTIKEQVDAEGERRKNSADTIIASVANIQSDVIALKSDVTLKQDRLEQTTKDFRTGKSIDDQVDHSRKNVLQVVEGVKSIANTANNRVELLADRVTKLEVKQDMHAENLKEIRNEVREVRSEVKEARHEAAARDDAMTDLQKTQFAQLCESIREIRKPPQAK